MGFGHGRTARLSRLAPCLAALALLFVAHTPASACSICLAPPERTTVDHLVAARDVVLAREDPARPFHFAPVEVLRGSAEGAAIPFLVDSVLRRRLAGEPDTAVLFARVSEPAGWERLRTVGASMRPIIEDVLARGDDWLTPAGARERFETFAALHDLADPEVRSLAMAELDKTPWRLLRTLELRLPRSDLWAGLAKPSELPWVAVRLKLLAIDPRPGDLQRLSERLQSVAGAGGTFRLESLALAFVAAGGADAVERLQDLYGPQTPRTLDERAAVTAALAIHATDGDPALRPGILDALDAMLAGDPAVGPLIARTLTELEDWSHADRFAELLESGAYPSPWERFAVAHYVMRAHALTPRMSD